MKTIAILSTILLASCADMTVSGDLFVKDPETGAKAGLSRDDTGKTGIFGRFFDKAGNLVGGGDVLFVTPEK